MQMVVGLGLLVGLVSLVGGLIAIWIFVRPAVMRSGAVADAILGEEEVMDRSGKAIQPARPGLVSRVGSLEEALTLLVENGARLDDHEKRLVNIEQGTLERLAAKVESAAMLRLISEEQEENHRGDQS